MVSNKFNLEKRAETLGASNFQFRHETLNQNTTTATTTTTNTKKNNNDDDTNNDNIIRH